MGFNMKKIFTQATVGGVVGAAAFPVLALVTGQPVEGLAGPSAMAAGFGAALFGVMAIDENNEHHPAPGVH